MINTSSNDSVKALYELLEDMPSTDKPILIWVGAGASAWCGFKRWGDLAEYLHNSFKRCEGKYDASIGSASLLIQDYPAVFQLLKTANPQRYAKMITSELSVIPPSPLFLRFCNALNKVTPVCVLTTNIDEMLEKHLQETSTVGRNDLARAREMLISRKPFVCKLHGSVSDIDSIIFTTDDYANLVNDDAYLSQLSAILGNCHVVFIGYGLRDEYLTSLLQRNVTDGKTFGDGPHYALLPDSKYKLPKSVKIIEYDPLPHTDHRDPISVLEELGNKADHEKRNRELVITEPIKSAHMLFHIFPPGTYATSQTVTIERPDTGMTREVLLGTGFSNEELPDSRSTSMHDVLVGLLCFDEIYAPFDAVGRLHQMLGSERFWHLVTDNILKFVRWENQEGIMFPDSSSITGGDIGSMQVLNPDMTTINIEQLIKQQLAAVPGQESHACQLFQLLCDKTQYITSEIDEIIPSYTRSLLLRPSIRQILGISGGCPTNSLTRWNAFPVLRLANVVKLGLACTKLGIASVKLDFGAAALAGPAFSAVVGNEYADSYASYVACGRFSADLGAMALDDPSIFEAIIKFRQTSVGIDLRKNTLSRLITNDGADACMAINGALREVIPLRTLEMARDSFINLYTPANSNHHRNLVLWNDQRFSEAAIGLWRKNSRRILNGIASQRRIMPYEYCPCGSGDKFKFCCLEALS